MMQRSRWRRLNTLVKAAGFLIMAASLAFVLLELRRRFASVVIWEWSTPWITAAAVFVAAQTVSISTGAAAWGLALTVFGGRLGAPETVGVFFISQLAKYVPGNIGHFVGRVSLAGAYGVPMPPVLASFVLEVLSLLAAGLGLGLLWFSLAPADLTAGQSLHSALLIALVLLAVGAAGTVMGISVLRRWRNTVVLSGWPLTGRWLGIIGLDVVSFISLGIGTAAFVSVVAQDPGASFGVASAVRWIGIFSVAFLAGFATPGAPAGIGVREAVFLSLGSPLIGAEAALAAALALRLLSVAADLLVGVAGGAGLLALRLLGRRAGSRSDDAIREAPRQNP